MKIAWLNQQAQAIKSLMLDGPNRPNLPVMTDDVVNYDNQELQVQRMLKDDRTYGCSKNGKVYKGQSWLMRHLQTLHEWPVVPPMHTTIQ